MSPRAQTNPDSVVHAAGSAVLDLQTAVQEGIERRPGYIYEVGGLLLGSTSAGVRIDAVQPLPIEHRFGSSFWLGSADIARWKDAVAGRSKVIGHFRSQRIDGPQIDAAAPQDVDHAIADLLNLPDPVLLLIPVSGKELNDALVYRRIGGIWLESQSCPLKSLAPIPPPAPRRAPALPDPEYIPDDPPRRRSFAIPLLTAAVLLLLLALFAFRRFNPPAVAATPIGLAAHPTTGGISIVWNRESPVVRHSSSGLLTIQDGDSRQQLNLTRNQLLDGSAVYVPHTAKVDFRLEIYSDRDHYSGESVSITTGIASPQPQQKPPLAVPAQPRARRDSAPIRIPFTPAPAPQSHNPPTIGPPAQQAAAPPTAANSSEARQALSANLPPPSPPPAAHPAPIVFLAPVPEGKVSPTISTADRNMLERLMTGDKLSIDVKVQIDASGAVSSAVPMDVTTSAQKLIAPAAVDAARRWRFVPASRNGKPIASDYVLTFVFKR